MNGSHHRRGFLFLEVMLALAIFSMAVVGLTVLMRDSMEAQVEMARERELLRAFESRLALARAGLLDDAISNEVDEHLGVAFEVEMEPAPLQNQDGQELNGLMELTLRATWELNGEPQEMTVRTYVQQ